MRDYGRGKGVARAPILPSAALHRFRVLARTQWNDQLLHNLGPSVIHFGLYTPGFCAPHRSLEQLLPGSRDKGSLTHSD